jgi:MFS family permease
VPRADLRLVLAGAAVLLAAADTYVVVLALPDIMVGVGLDATELGRAAPIVSVFLLGYVAVLPAVGRLADLAGRLPVLVSCLLVFALGSLITATAHTLPAVVAGRGLQGIGAGGLVPATLALVADLYPAERRGVPLGLVGAAQEAGALLGPLYGALVLAVSGWRTIFWVNLGAGLALGGVLATARRDRNRTAPRLDIVGVVLWTLAITGLVLLVTAPDAVVTDITWGVFYEPWAGGGSATSPLAVATATLGVLALARAATAPPSVRPIPALRRVPELTATLDLPGAALAAFALGALVLALSVADPQHQTLADHGPALLAAGAACLALFVIRERRARHPLVPARTFASPPAFGGMLVSFLVGAALIAALVDVPVFGRVTGHDQLGAALLLVRMLAAVPIGALLGGVVSQRLGDRTTTAVGALLAGAGLAQMSSWSAHGPGLVGTVALAVCGLGLGLTIAPINASVLATTASTVHGLAAALVVVARTVGMLVGLSVLTAIGLHRFANESAGIGSPLQLCPETPTNCPVYDAAVQTAALAEVHGVFLGAAVCAALAAVAAAALLRPRNA